MCGGVQYGKGLVRNDIFSFHFKIEHIKFAYKTVTNKMIIIRRRERKSRK